MKLLRSSLVALTLSASSSSCSAPPDIAPDRDEAKAPERTNRQGLDVSKVTAAVKKLDDRITELGGTSTIAFLNVETGEVLAAAHEHDAKNPASNAKLPTTVAALTVLGPAHRFATGLYGHIEGSTVPDLVLRGRGDPTLSSDDLSGMVRELRALGVSKVGKILVDQSYFDDKYVPPAFEQQPNEWAYFRAPVAAVSLNENTVTIWLRPTKEGKNAEVRVNPPGFVDVVGTIDTEKKGTEEDVSCDMSVSGDHLQANVKGKVPEDVRLIPIVRRVDDPRKFAGFALRAVLKEQGVKVGESIEIGGGSEKMPLVVHNSRPLGEIVLLLGKESDNFAAEMLLRATGEGKSGTTSTADGVQAVTACLGARNAFDTGTKVVNGSGLFDADRYTAFGMTKLLASAYNDPAISAEFVSQLSIGGVDGTLKHRFKDWGDRRAIRGKTGTLNAVSALSGYILGPDNKTHVAFSILVNDIAAKGKQAREAMDEAVESVASEVWAGH